jgi:hypothetical protein
MTSSVVDGHEYYGTYFGHEVGHLDAVHRELRRSSNGVVFLAGDSSLDNKSVLALAFGCARATSC